MKLFFSPGACSLSPHIALREANLPYELIKVDLHTKQTVDGQDFRLINPKGYVPVLVLDDGTLLTEGPAIVQYIADQAPAMQLAPPLGTVARYQLMAWLNFITSELHKSFSPLFNPQAGDEMKTFARTALGQRFDYLSTHLSSNAFLMGDAYTVADGYLFTVLGWCHMTKIELSQWAVLESYRETIGKRSAVRAAMQAEGIMK